MNIRPPVLTVFCFALLCGCQKESTDTGGRTTPAASPVSTASPTSAAATTLQGLGTLAGTLAVDVGGKSVPAANATVTIASHPEYKVTTNSSGHFEINNMIPGSLTVYATGTASGSSLNLLDDGVRAAQFRDVVVSSGSKTELSKDTLLTKPGSIKGSVALLNNPQNVEKIGVSVYIPGTSFASKTDADGNFTMTGVPKGVYDIVRFDKEGLTSSEITSVTVASDATTNMGVITMSLSNGPSGQIVGIGSTSDILIGSVTTTVLQSHDVAVGLNFDSRAVLMKVANESAFINVDWVPVASTYTFSALKNPAAVADFAVDGTKSVYAKFADENGLESSVYQKTFIIDFDPPLVNSVTLLNGWPCVAQAAYLKIPVGVSATDNGTGLKEMMLCNTNSFPSCGS